MEKSAIPRGLKIIGTGKKAAKIMILRKVAKRKVCSALLANFGRVICKNLKS